MEVELEVEGVLPLRVLSVLDPLRPADLLPRAAEPALKQIELELFSFNAGLTKTIAQSAVMTDKTRNFGHTIQILDPGIFLPTI